MSRSLYIAAYDITDSRRRRHVLRILRGFALDGQRSAYECPLDPPARRALICAVQPHLDPETDRFLLIRVEGRAPVRRLGQAALRAEQTAGAAIVIA